MEKKTVDLQDEVKQFIFVHIKSVAELEVLLFIFRQPTKRWTSRFLSQELRSNPSYAESLLQQLAKTGLLEKTESSKEYCFNTSLDSEIRIIQEIERLYQTRRLSLINLIYESPTDKIRTFADAFKIRN
ncbi:MAG: hypothetical protein ACAH59_14020 [Pseudobdellovibrionaceae bacterium]